MELKREVAKKAAFSRTDKPIPDKMIEEWEEREIEKNKHVLIYFKIKNIHFYLNSYLYKIIALRITAGKFEIAQ